jgi:hypothetical protein
MTAFRTLACFVRCVADKAFEKEGGVGVDDADADD